MKLIVILALGLIPFALLAQEPEPATTTAIRTALEHERRTEAEQARDENRKPQQTLEFFGFKKDMKVLELLPGGGWYTSILGPVLEEEGKLYLSLGTNTVAKRIEGKPGFDSTEVIPFDGITRSETEPNRYTLPKFSFGVRKLDMVLTFRNLHNLDAAGRANLNAAVFQALDKGGVYGVIDHTRRHMQPWTNEMRRREDPVQMIKEIQEAGFRLADYSDLHYRPDDELRYEVGRKTVTGNTDRFTLLFVKP